MSLNSVVEVNITAAGARVTQAGFGTPLLLSHTAAWTERVRTYEDLNAVLVDFAATTPEYKMAAAIFAQSPSPSEIKIGRANGTAVPTLRWKITPTATNSVLYKITVGGIEYSYTSDSSATAAEIIGALVTAINAGTATHGVTASDQTTYLRLICAAGAWQQVVIDNLDRLAIEMDHSAPADSALATALTAIKAEDDDWYALHTWANSKAYVLEVAAWVESNDKLYLVASQDSEIITVAKAGASDVADALLDLARARSAPFYCPDNAQFADCAWSGRLLPEDPGSETWAFKTLSGVSSGCDARGSAFTATHLTNLRAKACSWYETIAGVSVTQGGQVSEQEWVDVVRFVDWLRARMQEAIFARLASVRKVPFTDAGVAIVEAEIRGILERGIKVGGLAESPAPVVTVPRVADVPSADKLNRHLPDVAFSATLAGAIHSLEINGAVSV